MNHKNIFPIGKKYSKKNINLILLIATVLIFLIFIEIVIRIFFPTELNILKSDNYLLYTGIPGISFTTETEKFVNNITFNNYGFFDKDWEIKKNSDKRILIIGDSFTAGFAVPYDKHYARILEDISEKDKLDLEVMAAGIPSWSTAIELKFLERMGHKLQPDIVIIQFYVNDIRDNYLKGLFSINGENLIDNTPIRIPLRRRAMVYMATKSALFKRVLDFLIFNPIAQKTTPNLLGDLNIENYEYQPCEVNNLFIKNPDEVFSNGFDVTYKLLERFNELSKKYSFTPVLLIIPQKNQISDKDWNEFLLKCNLDEDYITRDMIQRKIIKNSPKEIIIVDLYPTFKNEDLNNSFYYPIDLHTNEKGNKRMAELIFEKLRQEGILNE